MRRHRRAPRQRCPTLVLVVVGLTLKWVDRIPAPALTASTMHVVRRRLLSFAREHGRAPESLHDLPDVHGLTARLDDGWGRPLGLEVRGGEVVLTSLGRDGRGGGRGADRDLVGIFALRGPDGSWSDDDTDWRVDPLER